MYKALGSPGPALPALSTNITLPTTVYDVCYTSVQYTSSIKNTLMVN